MTLLYAIYVLLYVIILLVSLYIILISVICGFMRRPPLVPTTGEAYRTMIRRISKRIKKCEVNDFPMPFKIVDAGCGYGTLIIPLAKTFPQHQFIGIEYSLIPYLFAKFRSRNISNIKILHQDMFTYDFKEVNFVICFLLPSIMQRFTQKCIKELKKKSYIFSNRFKLVGLEPFETIDLGDNFAYVHLYKYLPTK